MSSNCLFMERFPVTNGEQVISDSSQTQLKGLWFSEIKAPTPRTHPLPFSPALAGTHLISLSSPSPSFAAVTHSHWIPAALANAVNVSSLVVLFCIIIEPWFSESPLLWLSQWRKDGVKARTFRRE